MICKRRLGLIPQGLGSRGRLAVSLLLHGAGSLLGGFNVAAVDFPPFMRQAVFVDGTPRMVNTEFPTAECSGRYALKMKHIPAVFCAQAITGNSITAKLPIADNFTSVDWCNACGSQRIQELRGCIGKTMIAQ